MEILECSLILKVPDDGPLLSESTACHLPQPISAPPAEQKSTYQGPVAASFEERVLQSILAAQKQERENSSWPFTDFMFETLF